MQNTFTTALGRSSAPIKPFTSRTTNGMRARTTTSSAALDLFGSIGAMRGKNIIPAFKAAMAENQDLALRIAQWARDIRGGAGERQIYRDILLNIEQIDPNLLLTSHLLDNLPEIGRFDDLLIFQTDEVKIKAYKILAKALNEGNALAAKWMPRKGPLAAELRQIFNLSPKQYRKALVQLTNVVETNMCAQNWNEINFSHVPSVAMSRYMTAFHRNAPEQFTVYKESLARNDGSAKVNASAVYPYDIVKMLGGARDLTYSYGGFHYGNHYKYNQIAQSMWNALPDYMNDKSVIAVVDNSGSMQSAINGTTVSCLDVASSLGIYTAQKSKGAFKDLSISFSDDAKFVQHSGNLNERLEQICSVNWSSTNLHSVFTLILNHASTHSVAAKDMPEMVIIFSDMQFNNCVRYDDSAMQMICRKYEDAGYEMPQIVFWNLNDYGNKPVKFNDNGVALVSGFSPALMKSLLSAELDQFTPENVMLATVGIDRYSW